MTAQLGDGTLPPMRYSGPDDKSLPDDVKALDTNKRERWVSVWNSAYRNALNPNTGGGTASEDDAKKAANKIANRTLKASEESDDVLSQFSDFIPMQTFLAKLRELLTSKVDSSTLDAVTKMARGFAGGKAKAARAADRALRAHVEGTADAELIAEYDALMFSMYDPAAPEIEYHLPKMEKADMRVNYREADTVGMTCSDCKFYQYGGCKFVEGEIERTMTCDLFTQRAVQYGELEAGRLFVETAAFAEGPVAPEFMPYLPKPGTYSHPRWGKVLMSDERLKEFVQNFNDGVYQAQVPVDAEHETKLSGAVGWIQSLRQNADGSVDAKVDWTERGKSLIASGGYKYVSPEYWETWTQPDTGKTFNNVAIGAAITTRPFFKDKSLRPLVANEQGYTLAGSEDSFTGADEMTQENPQDNSATRFAEIEGELAEAKKYREDTEPKLVSMSEEIAGLKKERRIRAFTDEVMGRSEANNIRWIGEPQKHINMLVTLCETLPEGEDAQPVKDYIDQQRAVAQQVRTADKDNPLFQESGSGAEGGVSTDAYSELKGMAETAVKEGKAKTFHEAFDVVAQTPRGRELYARHLSGE